MMVCIRVKTVFYTSAMSMSDFGVLIRDLLLLSGASLRMKDHLPGD